MIQFGIGDAILHYPDLIKPLTLEDWDIAGNLPKEYVAVHLFASQPEKCMPRPELLVKELRWVGCHVVLLGNEPANVALAGCDPRFFTLPPRINLHIEVLRRAKKFIGTLSCFNCAAQVLGKKSCVLVNLSIKEPYIYNRMLLNGALVVPWNAGHGVMSYTPVAQWAAQP